MKKIFIPLLLALLVKAGIAQSYNPTVNSGIMNPAPLNYGIGECQFNTGNSGNDALNNLSQPMVLIISLSYGVPDNMNPVAAISGTYADKFNWVYDASTKTYQGTQNQTIPGYGLGTIKIAYRATVASGSSNPQNGFNVNITPPAYTNASNASADDNVSSYTYGSVGGVLPVKLAYFNATLSQCNSSINWKSATEENFSYYVVEYSNDGITFNNISKVYSKGSNSNYLTTHIAEQGKAFYRLRLVDVDGRITNSNIVVLDVNCSKVSVVVYPNPASDFINIFITGVDNNLINAKLFNNTGQTMINKKLQNGISQLNISNLPSGIYHLRIINNKGIENIKIVKK